MERRDFFKVMATAGATVAAAGGDAAGGIAAESTQLPQCGQRHKSPYWGQPHVPPHWGHPYPLGPDSKPQPGVPHGKVFRFAITKSNCYPGMQCPVMVYVPEQYTADKPACVAYLFDGLIEHAHVVFDNLIHKHEMPVTIGIGMVAGTTPSAHDEINPRFDRSFELDSMTDVMADFIIHEVLPEVQKCNTPDGLPIILSDNPNDRLIGGASSGGIGAFNVAWRRPDVFRRVCVISGTFVGMRGGNEYPVLIRKTEPKPLRIFINDGTHDEWWGGPEFGNWWLSNEQFEGALSFAGYQVSHIWGVGGHGQQGAEVFPDMMRWLWKGWPKPVEACLPGNFNVQAIVKVDEPWRSVKKGKDSLSTEPYRFQGFAAPPVLNASSSTAAIVSDPNGRVFFMNPAEGKICCISEAGELETFANTSPGNNGLAFGPDGRLYVVESARSRIVTYDRNARPVVITEGLTGRDLTVTNQGNVYVTEAKAAAGYTGKVWLIRPNGDKQIVADGLNGPSGIALTPDGLWLFVAEHNGHHGWNYLVQPSGLLHCGVPFYWFHVPDSANDSGAGQACMDCDGRAYVATRMGVQVFDRNGRVTAILPVFPSAACHQLAGICFGGADFTTLYVTTGTSIYRRHVSTVGAPNWAAPIPLPQWAAA